MGFSIQGMVCGVGHKKTHLMLFESMQMLGIMAKLQ
jgi:hypothetical protein